MPGRRFLETAIAFFVIIILIGIQAYYVSQDINHLMESDPMIKTTIYERVNDNHKSFSIKQLLFGSKKIYTPES